MKRRIFAAAVALSTAFSTGALQADWHSFWHGVSVDWHRNNSWPDPFYRVDRAAQRQPFALMAAKGWQLQLTLGDHDFDAERNVLNRTGIAKIESILQNVPEERRGVYVVMGKDQDATAARVDSVQREIAGRVQNGPMPPVLITDLRPQVTPAEDVAGVMQRFQASQPPPVLPAAATGGGESGGM